MNTKKAEKHGNEKFNKLEILGPTDGANYRSLVFKPGMAREELDQW